MAAPKRATEHAPPSVAPARFLIVEARFYDAIGAELLAGAQAAFAAAGASCDVFSVPGALEIPAAIVIALDAAARARRPYQGAVALGCVIRGETYHFEIVAGESSRALMDMSVARGLALGNGILTVDSEEQAHARSAQNRGDKGGDAARAALALHSLKYRLGSA